MFNGDMAEMVIIPMAYLHSYDYGYSIVYQVVTAEFIGSKILSGVSGGNLVKIYHPASHSSITYDSIPLYHSISINLYHYNPISVIRKGRDYVYGIWQHKVHGHGFSNHRQMNCSVNNLLGLTWNNKASHHWPVVGGIHRRIFVTGMHQWVPLVSGQGCWKRFHVLTSS